MFETIDPVSTQLSSEQVDNEPFGMVGPNTVQAVKRGVAAAGRTAASPFGALVTVTVADEYIRVLTARGNRVRAWAESELPAGVVQLGLIVDEQTFIEVLGGVLKQVTRNGKLNGQKVAVAITGRNMVQRRLTVFVEDGQNLAEAILNANSDSMSIRPDEMQIE
jgi:Tfp pilus assembly PilM family ATPase